MSMEHIDVGQNNPLILTRNINELLLAIPREAVKRRVSIPISYDIFYGSSILSVLPVNPLI